MELESLNSLLKAAAMVLGVLTALAAGAGWYTESIVSERQAARLTTIGKDVADARSRQAEAENRLKSVEGETARQQERAAIAERELLEVRNTLADRTLTDEQSVRITEAVKPFTGVVFQLFTFRNDREPAALSRRIKMAVLNAGWAEHADSTGWLTSVATGIVIASNSAGTDRDRMAAEALATALKSQGIEGNAVVAGGIRLGVGVKIQVAKKP